MKKEIEVFQVPWEKQKRRIPCSGTSHGGFAVTCSADPNNNSTVAALPCDPHHM